MTDGPGSQKRPHRREGCDNRRRPRRAHGRIRAVQAGRKSMSSKRTTSWRHRQNGQLQGLPLRHRRAQVLYQGKGVEDLWEEVLGDDFVERKRLSRIYYNKKFFYYPFKVMNAVFGSESGTAS